MKVKLFFIGVLIGLLSINVSAQIEYHNTNAKISTQDTSLFLLGYAGATSVSIGQYLEVDAFFYPTDATQNVTWKLENNTGTATLAPYNLYCNITGVSAGTVTVIAKGTIDTTLIDTIQITVVNSGSSVWVNAIVVQAQSGATQITQNGGTLQMQAATLPTNATDSTFTWSVDNQTGSAQISNSGLLTAISDGIVRVKATANDPSHTVGYLDITISNQTTGIETISENHFSLYPNPSTDYVNIQSTKNFSEVIISDLSGKLVKSLNFNITNNAKIDLSGVIPGVYLISISNSGKLIGNKRIVVE